MGVEKKGVEKKRSKREVPGSKVVILKSLRQRLLWPCKKLRDKLTSWIDYRNHSLNSTPNGFCTVTKMLLKIGDRVLSLQQS